MPSYSAQGGRRKIHALGYLHTKSSGATYRSTKFEKLMCLRAPAANNAHAVGPHGSDPTATATAIKVVADHYRRHISFCVNIDGNGPETLRVN
jgi:hypothetical protein